MTEKEKTIQLYMSKLDLSHEEAEQMWLDEHASPMKTSGC